MSKQMIFDRAVCARLYQLSPFPEDKVLGPECAIPLEDWLARAEGDDAGVSVGVMIAPDDGPGRLAELMDRVAFIALDFPKFTDGRAYSHARRLRQNYGYRGTILAYGDVLRDQLMHMYRCGINAFYMRDDQDLKAALEVFERFPEYYQDGIYPS